MPIIDNTRWTTWVENNTDEYGKACVDVARRVMELLDNLPANDMSYDTHALIAQADTDIEAGGITGYMAGAVALIVSECHSRGPEFRANWNYRVAGVKGDEATKAGQTLNPALLVFNTAACTCERDE